MDYDFIRKMKKKSTKLFYPENDDNYIVYMKECNLKYDGKKMNKTKNWAGIFVTFTFYN